MAIRQVQGDSVTLFFIKMWCLAKEIKATGVDLEVSLGEVIEPMSEFKKCQASEKERDLEQDL